METLTSSAARGIIDNVGSFGTAPDYGTEYFTAGLDPYLNVINSEYLGSFIRDGGSSFKMVVGVYGGGKTHFLYCVRDLAWLNNYVVSYISLSPGESPFHRMELVYQAMVRGITLPLTAEEQLSGRERGIEAFVRSWYANLTAEAQERGMSGADVQRYIADRADSLPPLENANFTRAVRAALKALARNDCEGFADTCQWLSFEGYDRGRHGKHGILQRIDKTTAPSMLRSVGQWVREIGYSGLVVLFDEAEKVASLSTAQREQHLSNLRELIDECGHTSFKGVLIFYAVPDDNFLEGRTQIYEALRQRLTTVFEELNPAGVRVELESVGSEPIPFLSEVGDKLLAVYETAYTHKFPQAEAEELVLRTANAAYDQRFGDIGYKRVFVQELIGALHRWRLSGNVPAAS